ncbi:PQQ-binding-like beta-propeller repeat protein [Streptomyces indicus]|uniref:PQQ-like domain-containing protein n=1 Tax=Streptomyces indicus TaxID=417292 RepID=A0A1G8VVJ1_9ACTN|nr:PQQ-binding-like beta-propeller repeat protein [Streptomyces indicus]SDJ69787.1 PQQ-like domain-containing protein [Streptomyces indicus]
MEDLHRGDPRALGPYRLLAVLTAAGGERRYLAHGARGTSGHVEFTLVQGESTDSLALLRAVAGPGFVACADAAPDADPPWFVCGYVPSLTLAEVRGLLYGGLPEAAVRGIGAELAGALARLHALGAAHGAVTPDAVLLGAGGARLVRPRGTGAAADDVAALAAVLEDAAGGRPPDGDLLARCRQEDPALRPSAAELAAHWAGGGSYALPARLVGALAREAESALEREASAPVPQPAPRRAEGEAAADDAGARVTGTASRRALLAAAGGLVLGAGGVTGWVLARGGTEALTSPGARPAPAASVRVPRGTAPPALWRYEAKSGRAITAHITVGAEEVVCVPEPPLLTAVHLDTGEVLWRREDFAERTPVVPIAGQIVTVRSDKFSGLSLRTGEDLWTEPMSVMGGRGRLVLVGAFLDPERLIYHAALPEGGSLATHQPYVVAVGAADREERWKLKVRYGAPGGIEVTDLPDLGDRCHVLERRHPRGVRIYGIDGRTGRKHWERVHDWPEELSGLGYDPYSEQLVEVFQGRLRAAPVEAKAPAWSLDLYEQPDGPSRGANTEQGPRAKGVPDPLYYVAGPHQTVHAIDLARRREHWRHPLGVEPERDEVTRQVIPPWIRITSSGRTLLVGHRAGVVALDARTGREHWRFAVAHPADGYRVHTWGRRALVVNGQAVYALPVT